MARGTLRIILRATEEDMAKLELDSLRDLQPRIGEEVLVTDWLEVTQERVNQFAEASGDHQWIHVDVERARRESPFGGPIAHGFLTLALLSKLLGDALKLRSVRMGVNYGCNRVRFTAPVPVGARIRARFVVNALDEFEGGVQVTWGATLEREGSDKPCLVAEWLTRRYD
jgi:acyl dehydratase